jgi:hypothetical protein
MMCPASGILVVDVGVKMPLTLTAYPFQLQPFATATTWNTVSLISHRSRDFMCKYFRFWNLDETARWLIEDFRNTNPELDPSISNRAVCGRSRVLDSQHNPFHRQDWEPEFPKNRAWSCLAPNRAETGWTSQAVSWSSNLSDLKCGQRHLKQSSCHRSGLTRPKANAGWRSRSSAAVTSTPAPHLAVTRHWASKSNPAAF